MMTYKGALLGAGAGFALAGCSDCYSTSKDGGCPEYAPVDGSVGQSEVRCEWNGPVDGSNLAYGEYSDGSGAECSTCSSGPELSCASEWEDDSYSYVVYDATFGSVGALLGPPVAVTGCAPWIDDSDAGASSAVSCRGSGKIGTTGASITSAAGSTDFSVSYTGVVESSPVYIAAGDSTAYSSTYQWGGGELDSGDLGYGLWQLSLSAYSSGRSSTAKSVSGSKCPVGAAAVGSGRLGAYTGPAGDIHLMPVWRTGSYRPYHAAMKTINVTSMGDARTIALGDGQVVTKTGKVTLRSAQTWRDLVMEVGFNTGGNNLPTFSYTGTCTAGADNFSSDTKYTGTFRLPGENQELVLGIRDDGTGVPAVGLYAPGGVMMYREVEVDVGSTTGTYLVDILNTRGAAKATLTGTSSGGIKITGLTVAGLDHTFASGYTLSAWK